MFARMYCLRLVPSVRGFYLDYTIFLFNATSPSRCIAFASDLDGDPDEAIQRSHEHTDAVFGACEGNLRDLWDGYGIVADVEVPSTFSFKFSQLIV